MGAAIACGTGRALEKGRRLRGRARGSGTRRGTAGIAHPRLAKAKIKLELAS